MVPDSPSASDGSCRTCDTPLHKGSDDVQNTSLNRNIALGAAAASNSLEVDSLEPRIAPTSMVAGSKRKFEVDAESSTQRHPDYQDSSDVVRDDTQMPEYG
jgi:hypothetical protein